MEDEDAMYDVSTSKRKSDESSDYDRAMMVKSGASDEASSSKPSWAAAYEAAEAAKKKQKKTTRLSGTVVTWRTDKGFGFIQVPGQADLYVHQRNVQRKGVCTPSASTWGTLEAGSRSLAQHTGNMGHTP